MKIRGKQAESAPDPHGIGDENRRRVLRRTAVESRTGLSKSTLYDWMKKGKFPRPIRLGDRLVAWIEADIDNWLNSRSKADG